MAEAQFSGITCGWFCTGEVDNKEDKNLFS